jgi:hypothetical protein
MRTSAVADLFKSGLVWAPLGVRWVEQVRDEMAAFPNGENDDLHDAGVYGLLRILQGGLMRFFKRHRNRISAAAADRILLRQVGIRRFRDRYGLATEAMKARTLPTFLERGVGTQKPEART